MKFAAFKNTKVLYLIALFISYGTYAQRSVRIGYIDTEYILQNVNEFSEASTQLDSKIGKWKKEIENRLADLEQRKEQLRNESVLLTKELIKERQEEIDIDEKEILDYQQKRFGPNGDLVIQRRQLMQPVQDQIFNAVQEIASKGKYDFIFDKSADVVMLYSADRYNISDRVLSLITRSSNRKQATNKKERKAAEQLRKEDIEAATAAIPTNSQEARAKKIAENKEKRRLENEKWRAENAAKREKALQEREKERQAKLDAREKKKKERDAKALADKNAREKAIEARKKKIIDARKKTTKAKDSTSNK